MQREEFDSNILSKNLAERVKELECLYTISRIATVHKNNLDKALELIIKEIPQGWQYPSLMDAYLQYGEKEIGIPIANEQAQVVNLEIGTELKGKLYVYFKESSKTDITLSFLIEEQALLNQIGHEISSLLELDLRTKQERVIQEKLSFSDRINVLGELTAGIAHELNTPLGNIIGYSELLNKNETNALKKSDLDKILKSAKHAREIVKKLMFFSCDIPSQLKKVDLNKLLVESIDLLKIQLNNKKIKVDVALSKEAPQLSLDPVQITQVIFNIVLNAIDAMEVGGVLTISTLSEDNSFKLRISDDGMGISDDQVSKLFQPFYTNKPQKGTGLGLAVSHGIIQAHKGNIEVESVLGKGSTFTIIIPVLNE